MATASKWNELEDYSKEELDEILRHNEELDGKENDKSDIDIGGGGEEDIRENEEVSDPEDEAPLLTLQQTWRPTTHAPHVKPLEKLVSLNHSLPKAAKPLDYFFLFLPQTFFGYSVRGNKQVCETEDCGKGHT